MEGSLAEKMIEHVLKNIFSPLHVWRSPQVVKGTKRRELTDVVAFFRETGYLFECKIVSASDANLPKNFEKRIAKAIKKASRQLHGAHRQLMLQTELFSPVSHWRAIIVLVTPHVDIFRTPSVRHKIKSPTTIHYISIHDFQRILEFFDTPTDFEGYLDFREKFYATATSRDFQLRPPEYDLISFYVLVTAYSPNPPEHFQRFFLRLNNIETGAAVLLLSGEELFVNRRRQLQLFREEREQFRHIDRLIENVLNASFAKAGPNTPLAKLAASFNAEVNVPMSKASLLMLCNYLVQLDRRTRIMVGKLLEEAVKISKMSPSSAGGFIVKAVGGHVFHFFVCNELNDLAEGLFQVNTLMAKYGMKSSAICGIGYFGKTIDESAFRVVYIQEDWKYDEVMQDLWENNPCIDPDNIVEQKMTGLTSAVKLRISSFKRCPCGSGRSYFFCHRFKPRR